MEMTMGAALERESEPGVLIVGSVERATSQRYGASSLVVGGEIYSDRGLLGERALVPNSSSMSKPVWVQTDTVFKKERIGRAGSALVQHGVWECLNGPPGKVVRTVLFHVLEQLIPIWGRGIQAEPAREPGILRVVVGVDTGKSTALGVLGGLEREVDERYLTVARADDAEVELEV
eukprot:scaffold36767_cov32-Attheya_sp.AAC.2